MESLPLSATKLEFFLRNYTNVICVDYWKLSALNREVVLPKNYAITPLLVYAPTIKALVDVGRRIGDFLIFLKKQKFLKTFHDSHLSGVSIGAHVAGHVGHHIKGKTISLIGRITGLEPAAGKMTKGIHENFS
jgi:hypothetical protein